MRLTDSQRAAYRGAMRLHEDAPLGERVAYFRRRRGYSQVVLAGLVGKSDEWLSQIERGARDVDRLSVIVALASALRIEPARLLGRPFFSVAPSETRDGQPLGVAQEWVPEIGAAMHRFNGIGRLAYTPPERVPDLDGLARQVSRAFYCSQTERWSELGPLLPDMIADAYLAVQLLAGDEQRRALRLQALVYRVASGMLDRIGEDHLPWIAAERSMAAAEATEDPTLIAGGAWRLAVVLRHAGLLQESYDIPVAAAAALTDRAGASPEQLSVFGALQLKGAVAAASLGDGAAMRAHLDAAGRAAERIGERNDYWLAFGPTNVQIHRVWLAVETGDPLDALAKAEPIRVGDLPPALAERQASHLITVAWAYYLRRRDREALDALRNARRVAPEQVLFTRRVYSMVRGMLKRERATVKRDLREMAEFIRLTS
jgi:transcriptional regulator with XRE-family HTH domain